MAVLFVIVGILILGLTQVVTKPCVGVRVRVVYAVPYCDSCGRSGVNVGGPVFY